MMAANRDLALPLVIVSLVLIRGYASLTLDLPPEDYYEAFEDTVPTGPPKLVSPIGSDLQPCDYDVCLAMQPPCSELAASTGCLCPGITLDHVAPEAPVLKKVFWEDSEVVIQWCAPYSHVVSYKVTIGGQERWWFGESERSGGVGDIGHNVEVCVAAMNDAGLSEGSCMTYEPGDISASLKAGLIGGALGFLLLSLLAVLLWRHRAQRKSEARISTQDETETQQPEEDNRGEQDAL